MGRSARWAMATWWSSDPVPSTPRLVPISLDTTCGTGSGESAREEGIQKATRRLSLLLITIALVSPQNNTIVVHVCVRRASN